LRLPNKVCIFRSELCAILIHIRRSEEKNFIIFSDMSSLEASGFKFEIDLVAKYYQRLHPSG